MLTYNPYEHQPNSVARNYIELDSEQFNTQCDRWDLNPDIHAEGHSPSFRLKVLDLISQMINYRQFAAFTLILNNQQLSHSEITTQINEAAANFQIPLELSIPGDRHTLIQLISQGFAIEEKIPSYSNGGLRRKISYKLNPNNAAMSVTAAVLSLDVLMQNDLVLPLFTSEYLKTKYRFRDNTSPLSLRYELLSRLATTQTPMSSFEITNEITGEYESRRPVSRYDNSNDIDPAGPRRKVIAPLRELGLISKKFDIYKITDNGMRVFQELQYLLDDPMSTIGVRASKESGLDVIRESNGEVKKVGITEMAEPYQRALYIALQRMAHKSA